MEAMTLTSTNGTDVRRAMQLIQTAGFTPQRVASEVGVTLRTVRRWAAGLQQPRPANRAALKGWVLGQRHSNTMRTYMDRSVDELLEQAVEALLTDAERAEVAELEARFHAPTIPQQRRSAFADTDPFLLAGAKPEPALPF